MEQSAGIAIVYDKKLLLVHPTNARWVNSYSIPKGLLDPGESIIETAIRETEEEVGIIISKSRLSRKPKVIKYKSKKKLLYYYVYEITSLSEIGLDEERVPKEQLQLVEVDWAGFIDRRSALRRINHNMLPLLNLLK